MNQILWGQAVAVFLGTLPLFGVMVWNLIEVKEIRKDIVSIRERLATLEERDRLIHPILTK
jgi:hypothetical protein